MKPAALASTSAPPRFRWGKRLHTMKLMITDTCTSFLALQMSRCVLSPPLTSSSSSSLCSLSVVLRAEKRQSGGSLVQVLFTLLIMD